MLGKLFLAVGLNDSRVIVEASSNIKDVFVGYSDHPTTTT